MADGGDVVSALAPGRRPPAHAPVSATPRRRRRRAITVGVALVGLIVLAPVALFAGAGNPPCTTTTTPGPVGTPTSGQFAAPLAMSVGRWYEVGATQYGGPNDPTSGDLGSSGTYLPDHPDSFAELSVLSDNPADTGAFTFADADALGNLPYGTPVRVAHDGHALTLTKQDIGYGQGPGQSIPYRLDVWWQAALALGVSKSIVQIQRLPDSGSGALLDQLPAGSTPPTPVTTTGPGCASGTTGNPTPTPIVSGAVAQINPITGIASAPADAPTPVREAIAAGNQLIDKPYIWGGGHADLDQLAAGYDCSGSSEYVLHNAGLYAPTTGPDSTAMEHVYPSGPGQWITVYANPVHMWLVVAGIVLDTAWYGPSVVPSTPASGPRWQPASTIQEQIAGNAAAGNPSFVVSHPEGL